MSQPDFGAMQSMMLNIMKDQKKNPNTPIDFGSVIGNLLDTMAPNMPQDLKNNMKEFGKTAATAMEAMAESETDSSPIDMRPIKGSKILLDDEPEQEPMKEPSRNNIQVLEPEELDDFAPRTDDIVKVIDLDMKDMYTGTTKTVSLVRTRLRKDPNEPSRLVSYVENKKFNVHIQAGSVDEQYIRYSKQGHEKLGYDTGDIVIILRQNGHEKFERIHDIHLATTIPISLYESYAIPAGLSISIPFIDGRFISVKYDSSDSIIRDNMTMCADNLGFPIYGHEGKYGKLYINFRIAFPEKIDMTTLAKLFPIKNKLASDTDIVAELHQLNAKEYDEIMEDSESDDSDESEDETEEEEEEEEHTGRRSRNHR
jgi:hypothetical protein